MNNQDPIEHTENFVKEIDSIGKKYTKPIFKKYPLTFSLFITFSFASILHGFDLTIDKIDFVNKHPWILIITGIVLLIITGKTYKILDKQND